MRAMNRAIRIHRTGGPECLQLEQVEVPGPARGEVLLRHLAIGVNFLDCYHRSGLYPLPLPSGIGGEAVGVVEALGDGVQGVAIGDRVGYGGDVPPGAYSDRRTVPAWRLVPIPAEIDDALEEAPDIIAAVVTGGGNDILVPDLFRFPRGLDCTTRTDSPSIADCQEIVELAITASRDAMRKLADAGVRDVIYFFYPHVPEGTLIGGPHPNQILDYAKPMAEAACAEALGNTDGQLTCHFVDLIPVFDDHPDYFAPTDIHPNPRGSAAMAATIWEQMTVECIAQPESSGCCEPRDHVIIE